MDRDEQTARRVRETLATILDDPATMRAMRLRAGISDQTLRDVIETGRIKSRQTAAAIEDATDGMVSASWSLQSGARGQGFYDRDPAKAILALAVSKRTSVGHELTRIGITRQDLWIYMNVPDPRSMATKSRVRSLLAGSGLSTEVSRP